MRLRLGNFLGAALVLAAIVSTPFFVQAQSQSAMTNQDVIDMVKAGLSAPVIVASIERAPLSRFDVQPSTLVTLKTAGVPDLVLEAMLKAGSSGRPAAAPTQPSDSLATAPAEAEVRTCVGALEDLGKRYGAVLRIEYGTPMVSQGGIAEMNLGAPSGTRIYPVMVRFHDFRRAEAWMYRDPFGALKCMRHGEVAYHPPSTKEEMVAAIKDGETVSLPVKIMANTLSPIPQFSTATLSISKTSVGLRVPSPTLDFSVPPAQIYNVDTQNWQLHLHLLVYNARTRENNLRQDVYLWDPAVQPGRGRGVDCSSCGDAVATLEALIQVARGKD
jgi:hypothetical protein